MRRDQPPSSLDLFRLIVESPRVSLRAWWLRATSILVGIANDSVPLSVLFAGVGFMLGLMAGGLITAGDVLVALFSGIAVGALSFAACRGLERCGAGPWQRLTVLVAGSFVGLALLGYVAW
jgi:hypothetical protein